MIDKIELINLGYKKVSNGSYYKVYIISLRVHYLVQIWDDHIYMVKISYGQKTTKYRNIKLEHFRKIHELLNRFRLQ